MNIADLLDYDDWASARLLEATQALTPQQFVQEFAGPLSSVRQQFVHLLRVSDRYRARLCGEAVPDPQPENFETPRDLYLYSVQMRRQLNDYVNTVSETELMRVQEHHTLNGTFTTTVLQTLQHMVNHATYHRGQVAFLLKLHGVDFPDTDLILWLNERKDS